MLLSAIYQRAISDTREELIDDLMVEDVLPYLRGCDSFTQSDQEIVLSKVTTVGKASQLLDILQDKNDTCFEYFREVLGSTFPHLAESLNNAINNKGRIRRLSHTEFGEILIRGGVPDRIIDYVPRKITEDKILSEIKCDNKKPILVHGIIGCGKSSLMAKVLHSDGIFPDRYKRVCWMSIGNIEEKDVISKLIILSSRLDSTTPDPMFQIPDLYKDRIIEKLRKHSVLVVLDDIWNAEIMKYFMFPVQYVVTSRSNKLFPEGHAQLVEVPSTFDENECTMFIDNCINNSTIELKTTIIKLSKGNPLYLSMIANLLKSNTDYINCISAMGPKDFEFNQLIKSNLNIFTEESRKYYEMLSIFEEDEAVSLNLLVTYWNTSEGVALKCLTLFCTNNLMIKKWSEEYKCNLYGLHDIYHSYLTTEYQDQIIPFQQTFINNYTRKYTDWFKFDHYDPYFFLHCGRILNAIGDMTVLENLFTDFSFVSAKIVIAGISDLLFDYDTYTPPSNPTLWTEFNHFFMRHNHRFVQIPGAELSIKIKRVFNSIMQLAFFENHYSKIYEMALQLRSRFPSVDFWTWDNPVSSMKIWETSHIDVIDSMDVNEVGIILASESGRLSLYEFNSGKCIFNYKILKEKVIFIKFLKVDTLEFIVLGETSKLRHFDILKLLDESIEVKKASDNEYDSDESDNVGNESSKIDFSTLRRNFRHILQSEFERKCEIKSIELKGKGKYITASFGHSAMFAASVLQCSGVDEKINTLIEKYSDSDFDLAFDFKVNYPVKKVEHVIKRGMFQVYILDESGSRLRMYDDLGNEEEEFPILKEIIYDFIIDETDVYLAAGNYVYKNRESSPLFSIKANAHIRRLSISHDIMALCLTNKCIQIWNVPEKTVLYSLKVFDFTDAVFDHCYCHLITTEQSNVSKWSIEYMHSINTNTGATNYNYRQMFYMYSDNNSPIWVLQKYNDDLEFRSYMDNEHTFNLAGANSKVTCFSAEGDFAFFGFTESHFQIYDLSNYQPVLVIDTVNNVSNLATFASEGSHWNVVVHYEGNKLKIFRISKSDFTYEEIKVCKLGIVSKLKIFKINMNLLFVGLCRDTEIIWYKIEMDPSLGSALLELLPSKSTTESIIDFDLNETGETFCAATSIGQLQIWNVNDNLKWKDETEKHIAIRICKFRPIVTKSKWSVVASVTDDGVVRLFYFRNNERKVNIIIDEAPSSNIDIFATMTWSIDGTFLIVGDNDIKKWKVPLEPKSKPEVRLPLTKLNTYCGGIRCIKTNDTFICTIDQGGFFYIFKRI